MHTFQSPRSEYVARFNRVIDYIQLNLAEPMDLEKLARIACFSPFHFHRLFRSWMGETLQQFIQRLRLEKAAYQLTFNPKKTITEIAFDCGFSSSATFARAFREYWNCSASEFRKKCKSESKVGKAHKDLSRVTSEASGDGAVSHKEIPMMPLQVQVQSLPSMTVAYLRNVGPFKGNTELFGQLFSKLCAWAGPRGLLGPKSPLLSLYYDTPELTPDEKQRLDVAVMVPPGTAVDGDIGYAEIPAGVFAVASIRILPHQYTEAWHSLMADWLPGSGYQPDDRPCMEIYKNDPRSDPEGMHEVDICLPVKPL